jgi:hypothetical protein
MLKLRIAVMGLIWASALLAPAAAHELPSPAVQAAYDADGSVFGPATPGPTDPSGPSA